MSALKYWLWLTELPGLTNQTRLALLQHFPTPEDVYYAEAEEVLLTEGITREQAILLENKDCAAADRILADCQRLNVNILTLQDAGYPNRLRNIYDPPCLLYVRGRLPAFDDEAAVAVVGTRDCTPYGVSCAEKLGHGLAAAAAAFRDSQWPLIGILTVRSQAASASAERPFPSLPTATAQWEKSARRTSTVSLRRAAPYKGRPLFVSSARSSSSPQVHTEQRNTAPMEARTVLGLYRSAQAFTKNNPSA